MSSRDLRDTVRLRADQGKLALRESCSHFSGGFHGPPIERPASVAGGVRRAVRAGDRAARHRPVHRHGSRRRERRRRASRSKARRSPSTPTATSRHFETKTDKKGEFVQIGLAPGAYKVTAEKDKVVSAPAHGHRAHRRRQRRSRSSSAAAAPAASRPRRRRRTRELKKTFEEGVAASRAGNHDEAIAKFTRAAELNPNCFDCYYNIAYSETQKKDYDKAEAAYKKAIEIKPDYAEAYSGLANVYNAQRKFDQAAAASAKAMELAAAARGRRGGRRQRRRDVQPGRHPVERRQDRRGEEAVRSRGRGEPESRRSALSARHGARERGQPAPAPRPSSRRI